MFEGQPRYGKTRGGGGGGRRTSTSADEKLGVGSDITSFFFLLEIERAINFKLVRAYADVMSSHSRKPRLRAR